VHGYNAQTGATDAEQLRTLVRDRIASLATSGYKRGGLTSS
jgi:hypothetical protein